MFGALGPVQSRTLHTDRPVLLDVRCGPNIPLIPPQVSFGQIKSTTESILCGDPDVWDMITRGACEDPEVPARPPSGPLNVENSVCLFPCSNRNGIAPGSRLRR